MTKIKADLAIDDVDSSKAFITNNKNGGAVWAHGGVNTVVLNDCSFYGCQAVSGSGINLESQTTGTREITAINTIFIGCISIYYAALNENYIATDIKSEQYENNDTINETTKGDKLFCPLCGSELVLRKAKRGEYVGESFYGCSNYPKCKYIRKIEEG